MKAIWKFPLGDNRKSVIKMPKDAKVLHVHEQFREGFLWAMVNPESALEDRHFQSVNTGEEFSLNPDWQYIGTYHTDAGNYVIHVFETLKP